MLRGLMLADENDRDLPSIALFENRIFVDVDLVQRRPELAEQGCDGGFGLLTKVTSGTRVQGDRKSTRLNSSHVAISYAVFCLKKKRVGGSWWGWGLAGGACRAGSHRPSRS